MIEGLSPNIRIHVILILGFAGFDALDQFEYYAGVTRFSQLAVKAKGSSEGSTTLLLIISPRLLWPHVRNHSVTTSLGVLPEENCERQVAVSRHPNLEQEIRKQLTQRKEKLLNDAQIAATVGYPIRRRESTRNIRRASDGRYCRLLHRLLRTSSRFNRREWDSVGELSV